MAAGMHHAGDAALEGQVGLFLDRQGVDIAPEGDRLALALCAVDLGNNAGGIEQPVFYAKGVKGFGDLLCCSELLKAGFGVLVQIAAEGDDLILDLMGHFSDIHLFFTRFHKLYSISLFYNITILFACKEKSGI